MGSRMNLKPITSRHRGRVPFLNKTGKSRWQLKLAVSMILTALCVSATTALVIYLSIRNQDAAPERQSLYFILGIIICSIPLAVGVSWFLSRRLADPLVNLTKNAERVAGGDTLQPVKVRSQDEFARLANALNQLAQQLIDKSSNLVLSFDNRLQKLEKQAHYLSRSLHIIQAISGILSLSQLVKEAVNLVREQFGLYFVGIYLVNDTGEWALLQGGTGEIGQALLASGHRIRVGEGTIGKSIANRSTLVTNSSDMEAIHRWITALPESGSEAALPLCTQGKVIGALSLYSDNPNSFNEDQLIPIQRIADYIASAIENANLYTESQETLKITRRAYDELSHRSWSKVVHNRPNWGYYCDETGISSLESYNAKLPSEENELPVLHLPIVLRGQVIGDYEAHKPPESGDWHPDEISLMNTMMTQLEAALESARLFQDAQERAAREQITHEITDQLHRATRIDDLMKALVVDIAKTLGASDSFVQLSLPSRTTDHHPAVDTTDSEITPEFNHSLPLAASETLAKWT
jgi:GAF domain-containing protein/HAMP domain-containing protein